MTAKLSMKSSVFELFDRVQFNVEFFETGFATDLRRFWQLRRYTLLGEFASFLVSNGHPRLFFFVVLLLYRLFTLVREVVK